MKAQTILMLILGAATFGAWSSDAPNSTKWTVWSINKAVTSSSTPYYPCTCEEFTISVSYNDQTGGISFSANDPSVSPGETSYQVSTVASIGCSPGSLTFNFATTEVSTSTWGSGNASAQVPGNSGVAAIQASHCADINANPLISGDCKPALPASATMTVTYTFTRPEQGQDCTGTCNYTLTVTLTFNSQGTCTGIS